MALIVIGNSNKATVMNCLKLFFRTVLNHIKQGDEIALDIKIGIIHILNDSKLMFRNYNPEVKLDSLKKENKVKSSRSKGPSSVLTPCTNVESTLSYRV